MSSNRYALKAKTIIGEFDTYHENTLLIENSRVQEIYQHSDDIEPFDLGDVILMPGLIDLHIHGREGYDVMDAKLSSLANISSSLAKHGVTGFLATTVTSSWRETIAAMDTLGRAAKQVMPGAQVLGGYSEGIFFTNEHKGAHNEKYFLPLTKARIDELYAASHQKLKVVALAPEVDTSGEMIAYIRSLGLKVNLGHTNATYQQTLDAIDAGACAGVHIFNGMRGIHHREPGCTGAFLLSDEANVEVIADGVHLHPAVLKLITKLKPKENITLISDCISAGGMPDGRYPLGKLEVEVTDGIARTDSGSLGGSTLALDQAVFNMHKLGEVELFDAVQMASLSPARYLGLDNHIGSISPGKQADLAIVGSNGEVFATLFQGRLIYCSEHYEQADALKKYIHSATRRKTQ